MRTRRLSAGTAVLGLVAAWGLARASSISFIVTALPPAAEHDAPASFGEPGIAIGAGGTVIVNAARANANYRPTWWISPDRGATWGAGRDVDPTGTWTGDADSTIGSDGRLYALNLGSASAPDQPVNPTIFVNSSVDGVTWSAPASIPLPSGPDQPDRPWLAVDRAHPERVLLVNSEVGGNVIAWWSSDHGSTFSEPSPVTGGPNTQFVLALGSRPIFDPADPSRVFLFYAVGTPPDDVRFAEMAAGLDVPEFPLTQVWMASSTDGGATWSNSMVLDAAAAFGNSPTDGSLGHLLVTSAIDEAGTVYTAFSLRLSGQTETHIYLVHSGDHGATWSAPTRVDQGLASNVMPAMVAGAPGRVALSWYGSSSPSFTDPSSRWVEIFAQSLDATSSEPVFTQDQVNVESTVHIGDINASGALPTIHRNWGLRDFQSIAVDACGMAHPTWTDDTGSGLTYTATQVGGPGLYTQAC